MFFSFSSFFFAFFFLELCPFWFWSSLFGLLSQVALSCTWIHVYLCLFCCSLLVLTLFYLLLLFSLQGSNAMTSSSLPTLCVRVRVGALMLVYPFQYTHTYIFSSLIIKFINPLWRPKFIFKGQTTLKDWEIFLIYLFYSYYINELK